MSHIRRAARWASRAWLVAGVLALGYAAYVVIDARLYQARELTRFEQERQTAIGAPAPAITAPAPPADGTTIGRLEIPRLALSVAVAQGQSEPILRRAVGHLPGTAWPGSEGNVVLAGHRDTFFRPLQDIRDGDQIVLKTREGDFAYVVESRSVVKPTDVWVLEPRGGRTLTLVTCFPFHFVGAAPSRFVVVAREAGCPIDC
jgi:sortase A